MSQCTKPTTRIYLASYVDTDLGYRTFHNRGSTLCSTHPGGVEIATHRSAIVAARISTQHILDLRYTLRMMGVQIEKSAYMSGDDHYVIKASVLNKDTMHWHTTVCEADAAGLLKFC